MTSNVILAKQIELSYRSFPLLVAMSMSTALLFVGVVNHNSGYEAAGLWFGLVVTTMALRIVFYRRYRASKMPAAETRRWRQHLILGGMFGGSVWGAAALFYLSVGDTPERIFVVAIVLGAVMIGVVWHAAIPRVSIIYMLMAFIPLALTMFAEGGRGHLAMGGASILLMAALVVILRRAKSTLLEWHVQTEKIGPIESSLADAYTRLERETRQHRLANDYCTACSRKLNLLVSLSPLVIIEWGPDQFVKDWNPAAEALFGYRRAEAVRWKSVPDFLFDAGSRGQVLEHWRRLVEKCEGFSIVGRSATRDGRVVTCSWVVAPLLDENGCWVGTIAQARDITAKIEVIEALKESRRLLEEAQRLAHIGHWEWDCAIRQASFSEEALRIFAMPEGWSPSSEEISVLIADSNGVGIMQRVQEAAVEQRHEFSLVHRIGADGSGQAHTWVRITYNTDSLVSRFIAVTQDVSELSTYRQQLHSLSFVDTLTGLPNRSLLNELISQNIGEAIGQKNSLGLMVLGLDGFKAINDTLGHGTGDQLLRELATRLSDCVRSYDTVARLGGDEFAILLPKIRDSVDLGNIARKLIATTAEPFRLERKELFITCSIGIMLYPSDGCDETELLRFADAAMCHAKKTGRNNFQFYSAELTMRTAERMALDAQLRQAERNGELELHYQPQIDLVSGKLIGAEALLRWNHPERGMVMPDKFIGIAEETGVILSIGEWVLRTGCHMARRWNEGRFGGDIIKVALNLSPRQFRMNDLVATIRNVLAETGCRPEWLECEITENLLLDDSERIRAMLFEIKGLSVSLSIDDFGTGYSSFAYLNRYPVEAIKIDRSFIRDIVSNPDAAELVKAIISMARNLHLEVVAEGVETAEQEDFLKTHGCHIGQGWLYGKAMPKLQFEALLRTDTPKENVL